MPWLVRAALVLLAAALPGVAIAANPFARMTTTLGAIDIELCGEVSAISKRTGHLEGHARDPISAGLSLEALVGPDPHMDVQVT